MTVLRIGLLSFLVGGVAAPSVSEELARFEEQLGFAFSDGSPSPGYSYAVFQYITEGQIVAEQPSLFESIRLSPEVIGETFLVDGTIDPDFDSIAERLVNGINERFIVWHFREPNIAGSGSGSLLTESRRFMAAGNPDLVGNDVTSIAMTVLDFRTDVPLADKQFDLVDLRFQFFSVPEPSAALLMVGSLAGTLAAYSRRPRFR